MVILSWTVWNISLIILSTPLSINNVCPNNNVSEKSWRGVIRAGTIATHIRGWWCLVCHTRIAIIVARMEMNAGQMD